MVQPQSFDRLRQPAKNLHRGFCFGLSFDNPGVGNPSLKAEMGGKLHALALQTGTPEP